MPSTPPELETQILQILHEAKELTIPDIEAQLPRGKFDTFDVRDAVWRLVTQGKARFTPKRYVEAAGA